MGSVLLGRTTAGVVQDGINPATDAAAWQFTAIASGDVAVLYFDKQITDAGLTLITLGIYSDDAVNTEPQALLGSADVTAGNVASTGIMVAYLPTPVTVTSGTVYWLGVTGQGTGSVQWRGSALPFMLQLFGAGGVLPDPWSGGTSFNTLAPIWGETYTPPPPEDGIYRYGRVRSSRF